MLQGRLYHCKLHGAVYARQDCDQKLPAMHRLEEISCTHAGSDILWLEHLGAQLTGDICYCWVPSIENTWVKHTNTTDFVDGLATTVGGVYTTTHQLNATVE